MIPPNPWAAHMMAQQQAQAFAAAQAQQAAMQQQMATAQIQQIPPGMPAPTNGKNIIPFHLFRLKI